MVGRGMDGVPLGCFSASTCPDLPRGTAPSAQGSGPGRPPRARVRRAQPIQGPGSTEHLSQSADLWEELASARPPRLMGGWL